MNHILHVLKIQSGIENVAQFLLEFGRMLPNTPVEIHQVPIEIVVDLKISTGVLMEQNPTATAKHLNVSLIIHGKAGDDLISKCFLSAHPGHKTIDSLTSSQEGCWTHISSVLPAYESSAHIQRSASSGSIPDQLPRSIPRTEDQRSTTELPCCHHHPFQFFFLHRQIHLQILSQLDLSQLLRIHNDF